MFIGRIWRHVGKTEEKKLNLLGKNHVELDVTCGQWSVFPSWGSYLISSAGMLTL